MATSAAFKAACLSATLATAWAAPSAQGATDFRVAATSSLVTISGLNSLTSVGGLLSVAIPDVSDGHGGSVSILQGGKWAGTIILAAPDDAALKPWEIVGLAANGDVVVTLPTVPSGANDNFSFVFPSGVEATLADAIRSRGSVSINNFLASARSPLGQTYGSSSELVEFDSGTGVGTDLGPVTMTATAVPEPASLALLTTTVAALFGRSTRKQK